MDKNTHHDYEKLCSKKLKHMGCYVYLGEGYYWLPEEDDLMYFEQEDLQ